MPRSPDRAAGLVDGPTILVVSDQRDWHARQMEAAFTAVGARVERIDLAQCGFDTRSASGLALPVLGSRLPDAVHVRTLSAGSLIVSYGAREVVAVGTCAARATISGNTRKLDVTATYCRALNIVTVVGGTSPAR